MHLTVHRPQRSAPDVYHVPVLARAAVEALVTDPGGRYLDATAGGGGHLALLLDSTGGEAKVLGIDRDPQALAAAAACTEGTDRVVLRRGAFADLAGIAAEEGMIPLDGILFDLGVSSRQIDDPTRGFTYREDAPLDMRMDPEARRTAADVLAESEVEELERIFREYGELRDARGLARAINEVRRRAPLTRSGQLVRIVELRTPPHRRTKTLSRLFQSLRIAVNDELAQLEAALDSSVDALKPGGRLVVIAYHSLEDRRVKEFLRACSGQCRCPPDLPVCVCDARPLFTTLTRRPVVPAAEEIDANPRARSARMRVAERTGNPRSGKDLGR